MFFPLKKIHTYLNIEEFLDSLKLLQVSGHQPFATSGRKNISDCQNKDINW